MLFEIPKNEKDLKGTIVAAKCELTPNDKPYVAISIDNKHFAYIGSHNADKLSKSLNFDFVNRGINDELLLPLIGKKVKYDIEEEFSGKIQAKVVNLEELK